MASASPIPKSPFKEGQFITVGHRVLQIVFDRTHQGVRRVLFLVLTPEERRKAIRANQARPNWAPRLS